MKFLAYLYAGAGLLTVVLHPGIFSLLLSSTPGQAGWLTSGLAWVFLVGSLAGAVGLILQRGWGFAGLYASTIVASFGLAICMVPWVIQAIPAESRAVGLFLINAVFIAGLALVQLALSRRARGAV